MIFKSKYLIGLCLLIILIILVGCSGKSILSRHGASKSDVKISVVSSKSKSKPKICDLRVQVRVTDPIAPYLSDNGVIEVLGEEGFRVAKTFPVKYGTQVVIVPELEAGRYTVQATYGNIIATKCVILGCVCIDNWREVFAQATADELRKDIAACANCNKYGGGVGITNYGQYGNPEIYGGWGKRGSYSGGWWTGGQKSQELKGSGMLDLPCSMITPCSRNIEFDLPKDAK